MGIDSYGRYTWVIAVASLFCLLADFGFCVTGVRDIAGSRNDPDKATDVMESVFYSKLITTGIACLILFASAFTLPSSIQTRTFLLTSLLIIIGNGCSLAWVQYGTEDLKAVLIASIITKFVWLFFVVLMIRSSQDILILITLDGISSIVLSALCAIIVVRKNQNFRFHFPAREKIKDAITTAFPAFMSQVSSFMYTSFATILLGLVSTTSQVGIYAAAEKVITAIKRLLGPIHSAFFPIIRTLQEKDIASSLNTCRKFLKLNLIFSLCITVATNILLYFISPTFVPKEILPVVFLLSLTIPLAVASNVIGVQVLINLGFTAIVAKIQLVVALALQPLIVVLGWWLGGIGVAYAIVIAEFSISASFWFFSKKRMAFP
jgi:O-antigen/teichoic acid export membrane protein